MSSTSRPASGQNEKLSQHERATVATDLTVHPAAKLKATGSRKNICVRFTTTLLGLLVLFLAAISHLFGSIYCDDQRVANLRVAFVDYDSGVFGSMLKLAYADLKGDTFPTLIETSVDAYPKVDSLKTETCINSNWWAALYTHPGATKRLLAALSGGTKAAEYNPLDAVSYVWDGVRYPAFGLSYLESNLRQLVLRANTELYEVNSTIFESANLSDPAIARILVSPIIPSPLNLKPTTQGSRIFLNTVTVVMSSISQFFGAMATDGIHKARGLYAKLSKWSNFGIRWTVSLVYSCMIGAAFTIIIYGFKETWELAAYQWVECWLFTWFNCNINFLVLDTAIGFLSDRWVPFFVLTWTILNLSGTVAPPELSPGFYKWTYSLPSHGYWATQITIYSGGCSPRYAETFPVMIVWFILGLFGSWYSIYRRCMAARAE